MLLVFTHLWPQTKQSIQSDYDICTEYQSSANIRLSLAVSSYSIFFALELHTGAYSVAFLRFVKSHIVHSSFIQVVKSMNKSRLIPSPKLHSDGSTVSQEGSTSKWVIISLPLHTSIYWSFDLKRVAFLLILIV